MTSPTQIAAPLARALEAKGYTDLTEVQSAVLQLDDPLRDLLVSAQTGSGKTVAFGLAIAPSILGEEEVFGFAAEPLGLVIAPTRELALQVQRELIWLYGDAKGRIASCVGGMDPRSERKALERGCHIVVGTPGRLRDHIERGALDMTRLRAVVLDEADEMLDFGFKEDLEFILGEAPAERRTLLFSATVSPAIAKLAADYQDDALRISTVSEREQHVDIEYQALIVAPQQRDNAIINTLRFHDAERAIVFCSTRDAVNRLTSKLGNRGFSTVMLSGELTQSERSHALQAMRDGRARVCVATDVAARGIDLPGLELVIHADLPGKSETLLHRSGRTGRAGQKGICALIVPANRRGKAIGLLRGAKVQADWIAPPSLEAVLEKDRARIFADPTLTAEYDEETLSDAKALLETYSAEQVAAAFLKRASDDLPAPEEIDVNVQQKKHEPRDLKEIRDNFEDGVWFSLNTGRKHRAEPRWLLPLVCRVGDITKREVGAIRIGDAESRVEISGKVAEDFLARVEAAGGGEKNIRISRVPDDAPPLERSPGHRSQFREDRPRREKPRYDDAGSDVSGASRGFDDAEAPKRTYKKDRAERPDRPEKSERYGKSDRYKKSDRFEKKGRYEKKDRHGDKAFEPRDRKPRHGEDAREDTRPPRRERSERSDDRRDTRDFKSKGKSFGKGDRDRKSEGDWKSDRKPYDKSSGKPAGKPGGKSGPKSGFKSSGKPGPKRESAPRADDRPKRRTPTGNPPPDVRGPSLRRKSRKPTPGK